MVKSGQTEKRTVEARVNGKRVSRSPRGQGGDILHYNPKIDWYFNESRGEQGERGQSIDPTGGGGGRTVADNWPAIERLHGAMGAVVRWRKIHAVMVVLDASARTILRVRYRDNERVHSEVVGLRAAMGDLATLAWHLCADKDAMRLKLSSGKSGRDQEVAALRKLAVDENRAAHRAWLDAERAAFAEWADG